MNKLLIIFWILSITNIYAQNFEENFLGDDFEFYKTTHVKLKDDLVGVDFNNNFYDDLKYCQSSYDNHVLFPTEKYNFITEKDSLKNRVFTVENIINKDGNIFDKKTADYFDKPIFVLKDYKNKKIVYYKYDLKYQHNFPFLTTELNFPEELICPKVLATKDHFTNETQFDTPSMEGNSLSPLSIMKVVKKGKPSIYYLSLKTSGSTVNVKKNGVILLFNDNTKWSKSSEIDVEPGKYGFDYSAFITLNQNDLKLFSEKKIKKFRLYIYDEEVNSGFANKFKVYTKCIIKK